MKTVLLSLTYIIGVGELILAAFFWITNSKNEIRRVMAFLTFSTGMWVVLNGLTSYTNPSTWITIALGLVFVFGIIVVTTLVYFALIFPFRIWTFDNLHIFLLYLPSLIFSYIALFTTTIVSSYTLAPDNPGFVNPGQIFNIYQITVSIFFIFTLVVLLLKIKKTDGINKRNSLILFWSILLGGLPAIILNLWLVFFKTSSNPLLAVIFSVAWIGGTSYILKKK